MKGMHELVRQAQVMQRKMADMQKELEKRTVTGSAGGGMVTAVVSGGNDLVSLTIDKSAVDPSDVEMLQDLVVAAVNDGIKKAKEMTAQELGQVTGGMKIPGMF